MLSQAESEHYLWLRRLFCKEFRHLCKENRQVRDQQAAGSLQQAVCRRTATRLLPAVGCHPLPVKMGSGIPFDLIESVEAVGLLGPQTPWTPRTQ